MKKLNMPSTTMDIKVGMRVYLYTLLSSPLTPAVAAAREVVVGPMAPPTDAEIDCTAHISAGTSPSLIAADS